MLNKNLLLSLFIFSILMIFTSVIKTQTRVIEKKIYMYEKKLANIKNNLHEAQLDYYYLSSPQFIANKIREYSEKDYESIEYYRIYFSLEEFLSEGRKISEIKNDEHKIQKK